MSVTTVTSADIAEAIKKNGKKIIDVSQWNPCTNAAAAKNDGVDGAIVKACVKSGKPDPRFMEHIRNFNAAGIPIIAAYDYTYSNTEKSAQSKAKAFVDLCKSNGIKRGELDLEDASMKGLGSKIVDIINIYRQEIEGAGMTFGIYTGLSFFNPCLKPYMNKLSGIPFWWARYPSMSEKRVSDPHPDLKYLPKDVPLDGWQYTSSAKIAGFSGRVDLSIWWATNTLNSVDYNDIIFSELNPFTEPHITVSSGMRGEAVKWVQWTVWRCGCFLDSTGNPRIIDGKDEIDGIFGKKTLAGVKEVQRRLNMPMTGKVTTADRAIWNKLF